VKPSNAGEIIKQWLDVHGLPIAPMSEQIVDGHLHQVWWNAEGVTVVESYTITDMAHGTPLSRSEGGVAGPYMIEAGISSSDHIAKFFGLTDAPRKAQPVSDQCRFSLFKENDTPPPHRSLWFRTH
jgi:poly(3-hydroxybutyrate) depolymerase